MKTLIANHRKLSAVIGIVVLIAMFNVIGSNAATSLTITLHVVDNETGLTLTSFHKTITNLGLVHTVQTALNGAEEIPDGSSNLILHDYIYDFTFAVLGVTTQEYTTVNDGEYWSPGGPLALTRLHDPANDDLGFGNVTIDGVNVMDYLHQQVGMPLPS